MTDEPTTTDELQTPIVEQYYAKHAGDLRQLKIKRFGDASAKQQLIILLGEGFVTKLQAVACGRRMNELQAEDSEDPLGEVLLELTSGTIKVAVHDKDAKSGNLKLSELRAKKPGGSKKQELLDLREAGSVTPGQTREGAKLMMTNRSLSLEQILVAIGAEHLLDELPEAPDAGGTEEDEGEGTDDQGGDAGEAVGEDPAKGPGDPEESAGSAEAAPSTSTDASTGSGPPLTLATFLDKSVDDIKAGLPKIKSKAAAIQLVVLEDGGKARTSLIPALRERAKALDATDDEIATAIEIAGQEGSVEKAYDPDSDDGAGTEEGEGEGDAEEE